MRLLKPYIKIGIKNKLMIIGNFDAKVGKRTDEEEEVLGPYYTYGERNERGWELICFCQENRLKIMNTKKKRMGKRWTWLSPNEKHQKLID